MKYVIKSLRGISFDEIYHAFHAAFADYEMQVNKEELYKMIHRRGFVPELSFAAFEEEKIIGFTLNGIGIYKGFKTAYDTGTGTLKAYRGQGLATEVFLYSLPYLKEAGIEQYLLEVLQHNTKAVSVYQNVGFETSREFNYFVEEMKDVQLPDKALDPKYIIGKIDIPDEDIVSDYWEFVPAWQNDHQAILRNKEDFICFAAYKTNELLGYCIFEPASGDITQIAVDKKHRRQGIATNLLKEALKFNQKDSVKAINTDSACKSIIVFFESISISRSGMQFEMIRKLV